MFVCVRMCVCVHTHMCVFQNMKGNVFPQTDEEIESDQKDNNKCLNPLIHL